MKNFRQFLFIGLFSSLLGGFLFPGPSYSQFGPDANSEPKTEETALIDQKDAIPLWGDAPRTDAEKAADEKFIADTEQSGLSKKEGAVKFINAGWDYYKNKKPRLAIRELNKAWLLDPTNYHIYWGFADATCLMRDYDTAIKWFAKTYDMFVDTNNKLLYGKLLNDYGRTYVLKGSVAPKEDRNASIDKAIKLLTEAAQMSPDLIKIYGNWSLALDIKKDYQGALEKANKGKELGDKTITDRFIKHLQTEISLTPKKGEPSVGPLSRYCDKLQAILVKKCKSQSALNKLLIVDFEIDSQGQIYGVAISPRSQTLSEESKNIAVQIVTDLKNVDPPPPDTKYPLRLSATLQNTPQEVGVYLHDLDWGSYVTDVQYTIKRCWAPPKSSESCGNTVFFYILRDGSIDGLKVSKSSGIGLYDQVALDTVRKAAPFLPFPDGSSARVGIDFKFDYNVFNK